jgi:hypothetical protein
MGIDIHGWVEFKSLFTEEWLALIQIWPLIGGIMICLVAYLV